jgi:hypothetical protein
VLRGGQRRYSKATVGLSVGASGRHTRAPAKPRRPSTTTMVAEHGGDTLWWQRRRTEQREACEHLRVEN